MAIIGIRQLVYGVEDVAESTRFFRDFGLEEMDDLESGRFELKNGAEVIVRPLGHASLPTQGRIVGQGVQEVVWGVDIQAPLDRLRTRLAPLVTLERGGDSVRFVAPFGVPMALRLGVPRPVRLSPEDR